MEFLEVDDTFVPDMSIEHNLGFAEEQDLL